MTKEIITQLKAQRDALMAELGRIERAITALDAAPVQVKPRGRPKGSKAKPGGPITPEMDAAQRASNGLTHEGEA